jgi:hypothetical protein
MGIYTVEQRQSWTEEDVEGGAMRWLQRMNSAGERKSVVQLEEYWDMDEMDASILQE